MRIQNILDKWPWAPGHRRWGVMADGVRKGEVQMNGDSSREWGWLGWQGYMHKANGPSETHPDRPEAGSHAAAASDQERRNVSSCSEHAHLGFPLGPTEGGMGSYSGHTSSSLVTSVDREFFRNTSVLLLQLSGDTSHLAVTMTWALDVLFPWDLAAAEVVPICLFCHCPLVLPSGRDCFSLFAFGVYLRISKTPLNLDKPPHPFLFIPAPILHNSDSLSSFGRRLFLITHCSLFLLLWLLLLPQLTLYFFFFLSLFSLVPTFPKQYTNFSPSFQKDLVTCTQ